MLPFALTVHCLMVSLSDLLERDAVAATCTVCCLMVSFTRCGVVWLTVFVVGFSGYAVRFTRELIQSACFVSQRILVVQSFLRKCAVCFTRHL